MPLLLNRYRWLVLLAGLIFWVGCSEDADLLDPLPENGVILAYGDSLTFGTGAPPQESYPAILAELTGRKVINAGVPGEVSGAGLLRLRKTLSETTPDLIILCHGGNDLLRQQNRQQLRQNLQIMIDEITQTGAQVILIAVPAFGLNFSPPQLYNDLAKQNEILLHNTILSEIIREPALKADQVHPNAAGYRLMALSIYQMLVEHGAISP